MTYSAINDDGFPASVSRTVAVCDPTITASIAGTWTTQPGTQRIYATGAITPFPDYSIKITKAAPGIFYVTDIFAGYYDQRSGYGSSYACRGYLQLLADNSLVCLSNGVAGWGDELDEGTFVGSYDPATSTTEMWIDGQGNFWDFKFKVAIDYANGTFNAANVYYNDDMREIAAAIAAGEQPVDDDGEPLTAEKATITDGKILYGAGKNLHGVACDSISFVVTFTDDSYCAKYGYAKHLVTGVRHTGFTE